MRNFTPGSASKTLKWILHDGAKALGAMRLEFRLEPVRAEVGVLVVIVITTIIAMITIIIDITIIIVITIIVIITVTIVIVGLQVQIKESEKLQPKRKLWDLKEARCHSRLCHPEV